MRFQVDIAKMLAMAASQLGYVERPTNRTKYGQWFGWDGVAWCAIWVSWCFAMAGSSMPKLSNSKGAAYCPTIATHAQQTGQWRGPGYNPKPGDLILFKFTNRIDHIGIVGPKARMADGRVHTYEGNTNAAGSRTGGMVAELYRRSGIAGFVVVDDLGGGPATPPPAVKPPAGQPAPDPQSEEDDEMPKLIRCNEKAHPQFGAVWAISGLTRTPVTAADYERWRFFAGAPAECDGGTFDFFMRTTQDISNWGAVALTVLDVRTVVDRIATTLGVPK